VLFVQTAPNCWLSAIVLNQNREGRPAPAVPRKTPPKTEAVPATAPDWFCAKTLFATSNPAPSRTSSPPAFFITMQRSSRMVAPESTTMPALSALVPLPCTDSPRM